MMIELSDIQREELNDALDDGGKLAAIKLYRQWQNCTLSEAKLAVERFARSEQSQESPPGTADSLDQHQLDEILDEIAKNQKLSAVKLYRTYSGKSLRESKEFVESLMEDLGEPVVRSESSGCFAVFLVFASLAFGSAWGAFS